jgi:multidrug resistance efflux pump
MSNWGGEDLSTVLPARIKPSSTFSANSQLSGTVSALLVSAGSRVKPGDVLAKLDSEELGDEITRAQRRVRFAESRLAALHPKRDHSAKRMEKERYQVALRSKRAAIERLTAYSYADLEKAWNDAKRRTAEIRSLVDQQLATAAELDGATARELQALNELKAAREHKSRLKQEADQAESQLRMTGTEIQEPTNPDALLAVQMELEDAREALKQTVQKKQFMQVRAIRQGTVLRVEVHPGDTVVVGQALLQIADLSELRFEVPISAALAEVVHPGRAVFVRIPTDPPRRQPAKVSSVLLSTDQDRPSYIVQIAIPNPNPDAILAGLDGAVEFPHLDSQWKRHPSF